MQNLEHLLNCNVRSELAKRNMIDFVEYVSYNYQANWHHELLCSYLDRFVRGEIKRLMVFMPPQHGKSQLVSRTLPAYILGKNPRTKIVLGSYSAHLANSFNRDCQRIIDSSLYRDVFPDTRISLNSNEDKAGVGKWVRTNELFETIGYGGFLKTVGVGGSLTGTPADFAIIDDPVKDAIEAMSPTYQERNWNWYTDVLSTRLHNDSRLLITQTRWDVNDLSGKILTQMEEGGEEWEVLSLPAIRTSEAHPDDPRDEGDALWPERHSKEKLLAVRKKSIRTYEALYQQNPKPIQAGGEFWAGFNTLKHVQKREYDNETTIHISLDNNVTPYVTCSVWQVKGKEIRQISEIPAKDPNNNAVKAAILLSKWLDRVGHDGIVYVYGDPSASARSTVDANSASFFDKYIEVLKQSGFKIVSRVKKSMPEIAMSANFINEIYESQILGFSIVIDPSCTVSIEDYYSVKHDMEGKMDKKKVKDPVTGVTYERYGHFSDAKRYFLMTLLASEFEKYKSKQNQYVVITK